MGAWLLLALVCAASCSSESNAPSRPSEPQLSENEKRRQLRNMRRKLRWQEEHRKLVDRGVCDPYGDIARRMSEDED